ncbi:hypothetical protein HOLleu_18362 [Holothuria leucospilota]|uniref:Uncharacterized protein n=1 Tax=Holothuria leucospilota TaxID=206669 RepID=A0A9Q1H9E1_HOLLE|nr:hypothetical protein HOLleu_18362 [Holothuria leucospilota]
MFTIASLIPFSKEFTIASWPSTEGLRISCLRKELQFPSGAGTSTNFSPHQSYFVTVKQALHLAAGLFLQPGKNFMCTRELFS